MRENTPVSIEVVRDGPYVVRNLDRLIDSGGRELPVKPVLCLCRCDKTADPPFCDGSHVRIAPGWSRPPAEDKNRTVSYRGPGIIIHDNRGICSHDGACFKNLPDVFRPREWKWIKAGNAPREKIIETIRKCPSGALSYSVEKKRYTDWGGRPAIVIDQRGPLNVQGRIRLTGEDCRRPETEDHYSLCTCGESKNKPFCDGTHLPWSD